MIKFDAGASNLSYGTVQGSTQLQRKQAIATAGSSIHNESNAAVTMATNVAEDQNQGKQNFSEQMSSSAGGRTSVIF